MQYQHACALGPKTHREVVGSTPRNHRLYPHHSGLGPILNSHESPGDFMALLYGILICATLSPSLLAADQASGCTLSVLLEVVVARVPSVFFAPVLWSYPNTMLAIAYCYRASAPSMESLLSPLPLMSKIPQHKTVV